MKIRVLNYGPHRPVARKWKNRKPSPAAAPASDSNVKPTGKPLESRRIAPEQSDAPAKYRRHPAQTEAGTFLPDGRLDHFSESEISSRVDAFIAEKLKPKP